MKEQVDISSSFEKVIRPTDPDGVWLNKTKPAWIVFYSAIEGVRASYYQAYRAVRPAPKGRAPWSIDNRLVGHPDYGYPTLEAAMQAVI